MDRTASAIAIAALVLCAAFGCANPASDATEAKVGEPTAPAPAATDAAETLAFTEASKIEWVGSKVTGKHEGGFSSFDGGIRLVEGDVQASSVRVVIDATSIWSDNEKLTGHLKSPDFFDVEKFPEAVFESTAIRPAEDGYEVSGNLTLHGVTKGITFPASIEVGDGTVKATAEFFVKRFDFGIEYPGRADDLIRDEVVIRFELEAAS